MIDMLRPTSSILSFFLRLSTKCSISSISFSFSLTFLRKAYISTISSSPKLSSFRLCLSTSLILSAFSRMAIRSVCRSAATTLSTWELSISYLMLREEMLFLRQWVLAEVFIFCTRYGLSPLAASMRFEFVYIRKRQSRSFSFLPIVEEPTLCNWLLLYVFGCRRRDSEPHLLIPFFFLPSFSAFLWVFGSGSVTLIVGVFLILYLYAKMGEGRMLWEERWFCWLLQQMGDCLSCLSSNDCSPALPSNGPPQQQTKNKLNILTSAPPTVRSSHTKPSLPDICIVPPQNPPKNQEREPSVDLREPPSPRRSSRSHSFSLGEVSQSNNRGSVLHQQSDSQIMRRLQEARRSSAVPVKINPTQSYLVDGGGVNRNEVTLSLVDGEIVVSRAQPMREAILESAIFGKEYGQSREQHQMHRPVVEQSTVIVHTKVIPTQNGTISRPNIEQSAVIVQTRVNPP